MGINEVKLIASRLSNMYNTKDWFRGTEVVPNKNSMVILLYGSKDPRPIISIPDTFENIPVVFIDESKI